MRRATVISLLLVGLLAARSLAAPVIDVGTWYLLPGMEREFTIVVSSSADMVEGLDLAIQIGSGGPLNGGTDTWPKITQLSVVGPGWDQKTGVLRLGNIRANEGMQRTLYLRVEGSHHREVELKPVQIVPDLFQVRLGKPSEISGGRITLVPLVLEIPKGARPANYLGPDHDRLGRITIQTNQPHARELNIYIEFSVRDES